MPGHDGQTALLSEVLPVLSQELQQLLSEAGEADLVPQVSGLRIVDVAVVAMTSVHPSTRNRNPKVLMAQAIAMWLWNRPKGC